MVQYCFVLVGLLVGGSAFPASKDVAPGLDTDVDRSIFFDYTKTNIDGRIVGGSVAREGAYPWMVAITGGFINIFICGGALITNRHSITAAHCIDAILSPGQVLSARITVGSNSWDNGGTSYGVRLIGRNPNYDAINKKNDIGIAGSGIDIAFNDRVRPIPISYDFVPGGILVRVSGWGWRQTGGTLSDLLHEIRLLTLDGNSCVAEVRQVARDLGMHVPRVDPDVEICTFLTGNEGICIGDGGSPLVHNSNNQLIGVASWGVPCARGAPDMFTRVSVFRAWIQAVLDFPIPMAVTTPLFLN